MKKLTYSAMAAARLRANKRQYLSLVIGIFLAIFLVTSVFFAAQGFCLARVVQTEKSLGRLDAFLLDEPNISDEQLLASGMFTEVGNVYVTAVLEDSDACVGCYDDTAEVHMNRILLEGRMPERAGEVAAEQGILLALELEREWQPGDTLELTLTPVDGLPENRSYTLVGILADQSEKLDISGQIGFSHPIITKFPALLTSSLEPAFSTGRTVVHRTMLRTEGKLGGPCVSEFLDKFPEDRPLGQFCTVSLAGTVNYVDEALGGSNELMTLVVLGALLALALLASCCIGIAGAVEGALSRRSEEIGLLRVVGATKRQIRRIFGRESLILALLVSPVSVAAGVGTVWLLSRLWPEELVLKLNPALLLPIILLSVGVILLAEHLPLARYARRMPMSVVRDTELLRRSRRIRSKKQFRVPKLIDRRLLRLYPGRQIGSCVLTVVMLFCALCAAVCMSIGAEYSRGDPYAFSVTLQNGALTEYVAYLPSKPLSDQSILQLKQLPYVERVEIVRSMPVQGLLDKEYGYFKGDNPAYYTREEYLEQTREEGVGYVNPEFEASRLSYWENCLKEYNAVREYLGTDRVLARLEINTVVLTEKTLREFSGYLEAGRIDVDAINAGREVIVSAPKLWTGVDSRQGYSYSYRGPEQQNKNDVLVAENDCFYPGMELPILQLWCETMVSDSLEAVARAERRDASVRVGAVLNNYFGNWYYSKATVITTEAGLRNMGLYANGFDEYKVYLDGDIDLQTEEMLCQKINAIASRSGEYYFSNVLEHSRESRQAQTQLVSVFSVISILFAVVSVSMIVSSVTRRIQSDGKRIGMLRAVGADGKTVLGCYFGTVTVSIWGGYLVTLGILGAVLASGIIEGLELYAGYGFMAMTGLALVSWAVCRWILGLRIREIVNKSIIENIREL